MDELQKNKMRRYILNANPFLWDIIPGNKEAVLRGLKKLDLVIDVPEKATYASLLESLIDDNGKNGVEKLIKAIDVRIKYIFKDTPEHLDILRRFWMDGRTPDVAYLQRIGLRDKSSVFLRINAQFDYVGGWTTFAGIWFEEIEPWIKAQDQK